jgi:hypothetical protein
MNVFVCDKDPVKSAKYLADIHVVKMVLESAQLLSTVCAEKNIYFNGIYKSTHKSHPCVLAMKNDPNYLSWVSQHGLALADEYSNRFHKTHKSLSIIKNASLSLIKEGLMPAITNIYSINEFPRAVFDEFKILPVTEAYQKHLNKKYSELWKPNRAKWTVPGIKPEWVSKS